MSEIKTFILEQQIVKAPQNFWLPPAYLFLGEERYLKEEMLEVVCRVLRIDTREIQWIDAEVIDGRDVIFALETMDMDDIKKIIIVDNADHIDTDTCKKLYEAWDKQGFPPSTLPIFLADDVDGRKSLWKLVKEEGTWCKFWPLFEDKIPGWIRQKFTIKKIQATAGCENKLLSLCGNNLRKIAREIDKLALLEESLTPALIENMVLKSVEANRFEIEDRLATRDVLTATSILREVMNEFSPKEVVWGLVKLARHALQAHYYLKNKEGFAQQLAGFAQNFFAIANRGDWNSISKRNDIMRAASAIIDGIPMTTKMAWTGNLPLTKEQMATYLKPGDGEEEPEEAELTDEPKKKKGRSKKDKIANFDIDAETKKAEQEKRQERERFISSEVSFHNLWGQRSTVPILKAFMMATRYSEQELAKLLYNLSTIHNAVYFEGEESIPPRAELLLVEMAKQQSSKK